MRSLAVLLALLGGPALAQLPNPDTNLPVPRPAQPAKPAPGPQVAPNPSPPGEDRVQPTKGDDRDMIQASEKWLKLIDMGEFGAAWDISAPSLKSSVTRKAWVDGLAAARKPFGEVRARKTDKFARSHKLPGLPEGDYALLLFDTQFANGKQAQEHLTWVLGKGDVWQVTGYFIK